MRIAVLADIHGNLLALEAVLRHARGRGVDAVVNLGDSLSGPLMPLETAQFLMAQGWMTIAGNHERQLLTLGPAQWGLSDTYTHARLTARELDWLAGQPPTGRFLPEVFICHGTPQSDLDSLLETLEPTGCRTASAREVEDRLGDAGAEVILCGHTHVPRAVRTRSGQLVVNPGSVGLPAWEYTAIPRRGSRLGPRTPATPPWSGAAAIGPRPSMRSRTTTTPWPTWPPRGAARTGSPPSVQATCRPCRARLRDGTGPGRSPWFVAAGRAGVNGEATAMEAGRCWHARSSLILGDRLLFQALRAGLGSDSLASSGA